MRLIIFPYVDCEEDTGYEILYHYYFVMKCVVSLDIPNVIIAEGV
jgi:hypothetical protein